MNYKKIYDAICQRGKDELEERKRKKKEGLEYYEGHHIIPESMGGEGNRRTWSHPNITPLTANEHLLVHKILCLLYPENKKLADALWLMINVKDGSKGQRRYYKITTKEYEIRKKVKSARMSGALNPMYGMTGSLNPMYGKSAYGLYDSRKIGAFLDKERKELLFTFSSSNEAANHLEIKTNNIKNANYRNHKTGGYYWKYLEEEEKVGT
jgi:hypothetical protein